MKFYIKILGLIVLVPSLLQARYSKVSSKDRFYNALEKDSQAIIMLYDRDKKGIEKELREHKKEMRSDDEERAKIAKESYDSLKEHKQKLIDLKKMFKDMSKSNRYNTGSLRFISVNVSKGNLRELMREFKIMVLPTFILFKNNARVEDATLRNTYSRQKVHAFIEEHFGDDLDDRIKEKRDLEVAQSYAAATPVYYSDPFIDRWRSWYGPRWSSPYGRRFGYRRIRRPRVGFGIGFGISG